MTIGDIRLSNIIRAEAIRPSKSGTAPPVETGEAEALVSYLTDAAGFRGEAARVVRPRDEAQIARILEQAAVDGTPVTLRGAGTGLTGTGVPQGGILLSSEEFSRIDEPRQDSKGNWSAVVEPGARVEEIQKKARSCGLIYPVHPTEQNAAICGNAATDATGDWSFKYGRTRDWVRRLRVLVITPNRKAAALDLPRGACLADSKGEFLIEIPDGTVLRWPAPRLSMPSVKSGVGYFSKPGMDLVDLFIGSEGTLGVTTEIELGLIPEPEGLLAGVAFFPTEKDAYAFGADARKGSARSLEYIDGRSLDLIRERHPEKFSKIPAGARSAVFFEQELTSETEESLLEGWQNLLAAHRALLDQSWFATGAAEQEEFRAFRHAVPAAVNELMAQRNLRKVGTDFALPQEAFARFMEGVKESADRAGIDAVVFGHLGEFHLHVNLLPKSEKEFDTAQVLYGELCRRAVAEGGSVSAEHGVGKKRALDPESRTPKPLAWFQYGDEGLTEMARVKRAIEPTGILGIGNLFPKE